MLSDVYAFARRDEMCLSRKYIGKEIKQQIKNPSRVKRNDLKTLLLGMKLFCSLMDYYTRATQTRDLLINSFTNKTHCPDLENSSRLISLLESELFVEESFNDVKVFFSSLRTICGSRHSFAGLSLFDTSPNICCGSLCLI